MEGGGSWADMARLRHLMRPARQESPQATRSLRRCATCVVSLALMTWIQCATVVNAYAEGDPIHAARRSLHDGWRTEWTELLPSQRPHFMREDTVALKLDPAATAAIAAAASDSPVKLSLSFAGERLLVPWITVVDGTASGSPRLLRKLVLTFSTFGNDVTAVDWEAIYDDSSDVQSISESHDGGVLLQYRFEREAVSDAPSAMALLLAFGTTSLVAAAALVFCEHGFPS